jgi:multiple sugar transport system permease protein
MMRSKSFRTLQYLFAGFVTVFTLSPFVWLFISSISFQIDLTSVPLHWIPKRITFDRYIEIFTNSNNDIAYAFKMAMLNSLVVVSFVTIIALVIGGLAAYAIARYQFKFRKSIVYLFLFTYMIPPVVIVIPLYLLFSKMNLLDSKLTLIMLDLTFIVPFVIWIMQSYFASISKEFDEAAELDGCSRLQTLWHVVFPIVRPGIIATGIMAALLSWDEFLYSLLFTSTLQSKTISVAIAEFSGKNMVDFGMIATGGVLASLPPLLVALIFQRFLVQGMAAGGIKE